MQIDCWLGTNINENRLFTTYERVEGKIASYIKVKAVHCNSAAVANEADLECACKKAINNYQLLQSRLSPPLL